jgi:hypothetical protein
VSFRAVSAVIDRYPGPESRMRVLLAIAHFCNDRTLTWAIPLTRIALKARYARGRVRSQIQKLEIEGLITRVHVGGGRANASVYRLNLDHLLGLPDLEEQHKRTRSGTVNQEETYPQRDGSENGNVPAEDRKRTRWVSKTYPERDTNIDIYKTERRELAPLAPARTPEDRKRREESQRKIRELGERLKRRDFPVNRCPKCSGEGCGWCRPELQRQAGE